MSKFHVNDKGNAGECSAEKGNCPFGGDNEHYSTADDARKAYEKFQEGGSWGNIAKDSKLELMRATRGSFFVKDGKVFEVSRNWTKGENIDVALTELTPDGFQGKTEYLSEKRGDTAGYSITTLDGALKTLAAQNPEGRAAQALSEGKQVKTFMQLSMDGEKLDFAKVKPLELYTNSNSYNGNIVYLVTNVSHNDNNEVVSAELIEVRPGDFDGYPIHLSEESPAHINKDTFRKLSEGEVSRFKQLRKTLGDQDWEEILAIQKSSVEKRVAEALAELPEAEKRAAAGDYSIEVSDAFQNHANSLYQMSKIHSVEKSDDVKGRLELKREGLKSLAKAREIQYKNNTKGTKVFKKLDSNNIYKQNLDSVNSELSSVEARLTKLNNSGA